MNPCIAEHLNPQAKVNQTYERKRQAANKKGTPEAARQEIDAAIEEDPSIRQVVNEIRDLLRSR